LEISNTTNENDTCHAFGLDVSATQVLLILFTIKADNTTHQQWMRSAKKKTFYTSYPKSYDKLNESQKNSVITFWNSISTEGKETILAQAKSNRQDTDDATDRTGENTTKDDLARLVHLIKDPQSQTHWVSL
jgi:hypothetical protein